MLGITDYLWRLVPANPILLRVVEAGGRRKRDLLVRCGYLGLLVVLVLFALFSQGQTLTSQASLGELASISRSIFMKMSYLQLALVALLAPVFTAGAITQEKDGQTYDILLTTPLSNAQIVLGSLLSRLFFVLALLISGIPVFSVTMIFGGVATGSIVHSFLLAAATALVTGAMAMAIATFRVGTRRTIFSFYLFIVIYMVGLFLLDKVPFFHIVTGTDPVTKQPVLSQTSWFTALHPFLALRVIFNEKGYLPPELGSLPPGLQVWPLGWYWTAPHSFYTTATILFSLVLVLPSIVLLRRLAQSTTTPRQWLLAKVGLGNIDRRRRPRAVWSNPIAWREARTKASAARASAIRYAFIAGGLIGALVLVIQFSRETKPADYIQAGSYNESDSLIAIFSQAKPTTTYKITPATQILFEGEPAPRGILHGRYSVRGLPSIRGTQLLSIDLEDMPRRLSLQSARGFLLGAVIVEFAVILLIITNAAASAVTREKEDGSLDLLLATPITSRYYIWGKLRGLVSYVLPLVAVPVASVMLFVGYDLLRYLGSGAAAETFRWIVFPEALLVLPGLLIIVAAFASILGMQMSLRCRTTVRAVMSSVGIVMGLCIGLGWCGYSALGGIKAGPAVLALGSFSPFTLLTVLIDPASFGGEMLNPQVAAPGDITLGRVIVVSFSWIATAVYAAVVWTMYRSMVKNFDMTIRKQST
jgi:ABC-type transport system involved in multi-copper enzyme maturation permease subunit